MRALVVTNMYPSPAAPARGIFVRDQVQALSRLPGIEIELYAFAPGGGSPYPRAARALRRRYGGTHFDVVHAHFGLTAWPALALRGAPHAVTLHGSDLVVRRSRAVTLAALPLLDLVAPVSEPLAALLPRSLVRGRMAVLPCGVDIGRFGHIDRAEARAELGLAAERRYVLFPADPARPEKRFDRAQRLLAETRWESEAPPELLTLGAVAPSEVTLWVNASDAVLIPSERESFGLAVLEALACDVPVLATDVGIAPEALAGVAGTHCGRFDTQAWGAALRRVLEHADPRVAGRAVAERYSASTMAERVVATWRTL